MEIGFEKRPAGEIFGGPETSCHDSEHFGLGVISAPKMNVQKRVSCLSHVQAASGKIAFLRWKHPECPGFVTEKENSFYRLCLGWIREGDIRAAG